MIDRISINVKNCAESITLKMAAKTTAFINEGFNVVNFGIGEPDFDTPDYIKCGGNKAIEMGYTKYDAVAGNVSLRQAITQKLKKDNNLDYSADDVVVTSGAKSALSLALHAILNPGDEVLIPSPFWVSYTEMVKLYGGLPKIIKTAKENDFKLTGKVLEKNITDRTKVLMINSPVNPTGALYSAAELETIAQVAVKNNLVVISDEIYEEFLYDGSKAISIGSINPKIKENTITINGFSKTYAMTGWRLGYLAGPKDIVAGIKRIQGHTLSHPSTISMHAGLYALTEKENRIDPYIKCYDERRKAMMTRLNKIEGLSNYIYPRSAFYVFVNIEKILKNSIKEVTSSYDFCDKLLEKQKVVTIPGEAFGKKGYVRFAYTVSPEVIDEGFNRIEEFIKGLYKSDEED